MCTFTHTNCTPCFSWIPRLGFTHPPTPSTLYTLKQHLFNINQGPCLGSEALSMTQAVRAEIATTATFNQTAAECVPRSRAPTHQPALIYSLLALRRMTWASHLESSCAKCPGGEKGGERWRKKKETNTLSLTCAPPCSFRGIVQCFHSLISTTEKKAEKTSHYY